MTDTPEPQADTDVDEGILEPEQPQGDEPDDNAEPQDDDDTDEADAEPEAEPGA